MKVYLYAKSGHDIGLDATRRCSVLAKLLQKVNCDPILITSDFRAGAYAKSHLGVNHYVSVDTVTNLPTIIKEGDILIYDTDENTEFMIGTMTDLCTLVYKMPNDIAYTIVDEDLFTKQINHSDNKLIYFGDDDYNEDLLKVCKGSSKQDISLLWGHFFFSKNKNHLLSYFNEIVEDDEYINAIKNTKHLLSASLHTCLESLSCGNKPILLKRKNNDYDEELIKKLHLPNIQEDKIDEVIIKFNSIIKNYPKINNLEVFDTSLIIHDIFVRIDTFRKLSS